MDLEAGSGARGSQELSSEFSGALGVHGRAGFEALLGPRRAPQTWPSLDGAASRPPDPRDREAPRPELPEAAGQRPGALVREPVRCPVLVPPRRRRPTRRKKEARPREGRSRQRRAGRAGGQEARGRRAGGGPAVRGRGGACASAGLEKAAPGPPGDRARRRPDAAMSAALFSLDGPARGAPWTAEPAAFYEPGRAGKPGRGAEPAASAMYDDESAIDFSAYIDSMAAVPTLELCHDELFADLFNSNHKAGALELLPGGPARLGGPGPAPRPLKREPDWGDGDAPGSLLPAQVAACAQTVVSLAAAAQPTPPASPEPPRRSPAPPAPGPARDKAAGKRGPDRGSPEYRQRRERNNIAVRKSRDKAKRRNQEMQQKLVELSAENEKLQQRVEQLTRDLAGLRRFFKQLPGAPFLPGAGAADAR